MKATCSVSLRISLMFILVMPCILATSQRAITWKGGTPGMKNEWNCPQNWSPNTIPDEFSNVFIPDVSTGSLSSPVLKSGRIEINQLRLESNSKLTIEKEAQLIVLGQAEGIRKTNLQVNGIFMVLDGGMIPAKSVPLVKN